MIDATGSMYSYIANTKAQISKIIQTCAKQFRNKVTHLSSLYVLPVFLPKLSYISHRFYMSYRSYLSYRSYMSFLSYMSYISYLTYLSYMS